MTLKAAAAGLGLGGGKGVIAAPAGGPPTGELRRELLLDFGDLVASLDGAYVTAEDVGTSAEDMAVIAERTEHVVGRDTAHGGSGDPSPVTALGVLAAMRACARVQLGTRRLQGTRVCVIGLGHVGAELARLLAEEGARLQVSDIDPERRAVAKALGARWVSPTPPSSPIATCSPPARSAARSGRATPASCGRESSAARPTTCSPRPVAAELQRHGIVYAPDFIANAGGLISVYAEIHNLDDARTARLVDGIGEAIAAVLSEAEARSTTPLDAATELARERLAVSRDRGGTAVAG